MPQWKMKINVPFELSIKIMLIAGKKGMAKIPPFFYESVRLSNRSGIIERGNS